MQHHLTEERHREIKDELERLKKDARQEIAERLKRAKEYGDLSENSEYIEVKEAQAKLEARIFEIEEIVRNAVIIKKPTGKDVIAIGSTFESQKDGKVFRYTIVGSHEAKPEANLISNESPLGRAFLNRKAGDLVEAQTPKGKVVYKITKIE